MSARRTPSKSRSAGRQPNRSQYAHAHSVAGSLKTQSADTLQSLDVQWLREMRSVVRIISRQVDELELPFRAFDVLESKQAVRSWFNRVVPALGARPADLCQTLRGQHAVLRKLGRIEHGVHS